jgi:phospholipid transport system substrate-binding protein
MKKIVTCLALLFFGLSLFTDQAMGQTKTATDFVSAMLNEVAAIKDDPRLQGREMRNKRKDLIREVILKDFDLEDMAKNALGQKQWDSMSKEQHLEFRTIFQDLFLESYSRLVLDFMKKEQIGYGTQETVQGRTVVKTTIRRLEDEIPVNYMLSDLRGGWSVKDVTIDGVSIVENYRRTFARVIRQESFNGLLKKMRLQQKAAQDVKER